MRYLFLYLKIHVSSQILVSFFPIDFQREGYSVGVGYCLLRDEVAEGEEVILAFA